MLHRTKDQQLIPIASLDDNHLVNIIKYPFRPYSINISAFNQEINSYLIGKEIKEKVMTPEVFNSIVSNIYFYIIEGFRRTSTRDTVIDILALHNPIFKSTEKVKFEANHLLNNKTNDVWDYEDDDSFDPSEYIDHPF